MTIEDFHNTCQILDQLSHQEQLEKLDENFLNHSKDIGQLPRLRGHKSVRSQRVGKQRTVSVAFCAASLPRCLLVDEHYLRH